MKTTHLEIPIYYSGKGSNCHGRGKDSSWITYKLKTEGNDQGVLCLKQPFPGASRQQPFEAYGSSCGLLCWFWGSNGSTRPMESTKDSGPWSDVSNTWDGVHRKRHFKCSTLTKPRKKFASIWCLKPYIGSSSHRACCRHPGVQSRTPHTRTTAFPTSPPWGSEPSPVQRASRPALVGSPGLLAWEVRGLALSPSPHTRLSALVVSAKRGN